MRYSTAMVLSTFAAGQAVASAGHHGHAQFHHRQEAKRGLDDVDWKALSLDLSGVDWSKVNYGGGAASPSTPAATPASTPAASPQEAPPAPAPAVPSPSPVAAKPSPSPSPSPVVETESTDSSAGDIVSDIFSGIQSLATKLGAQLGLNTETANGKVWLGNSGSKYTASFTNSGSKDGMLWCWGKDGMWINAHQPLISVKLAKGQSQTVSIAEGYSGGCGFSYPDSGLFMGLLHESILEFTAGKGANGCFDVSREINMDGVQMTAKGSKCTSGLHENELACVFFCKNGAQTCGDSGSYDITLGNQPKGSCMQGTDPYTHDPSGGCQMGDDGEHIDVTVNDSRTWPAAPA